MPISGKKSQTTDAEVGGALNTSGKESKSNSKVGSTLSKKKDESEFKSTPSVGSTASKNDESTKQGWLKRQMSKMTGSPRSTTKSDAVDDADESKPGERTKPSVQKASTAHESSKTEGSKPSEMAKPSVQKAVTAKESSETETSKPSEMAKPSVQKASTTKEISKTESPDTRKAAPSSDTAPNQTTLPSGWASAVDKASGKTYYYSKATGEVTWKIPPKKENEPLKDEPATSTEKGTSQRSTSQVPKKAAADAEDSEDFQDYEEEEEEEEEEEKVDSEKDPQKKEATLKIQAAQQGKSSSQVTAKLRAENEEQQKKEEAALKIQSVQRGKSSRQMSAELAESKKKSVEAQAPASKNAQDAQKSSSEIFVVGDTEDDYSTAAGSKKTPVDIEKNGDWVHRKMPIPGIGLSVDDLVAENRKLRVEVQKIKEKVKARKWRKEKGEGSQACTESSGGVSDVGEVAASFEQSQEGVGQPAQMTEQSQPIGDEDVERRRQQLCTEIRKLQLENQQLRSRQGLQDVPYSARSHCTTMCPQSPWIGPKNDRFSPSWSSWSARSPRLQGDNNKTLGKERCSPALSSRSGTHNESDVTPHGRTQRSDDLGYVCSLDPVPSGVELYQRQMSDLREQDKKAQRRRDMVTILTDLGYLNQCSDDNLPLYQGHSTRSHEYFRHQDYDPNRQAMQSQSWQVQYSPSAPVLNGLGVAHVSAEGETVNQKDYLKAFVHYLG